MFGAASAMVLPHAVRKKDLCANGSGASVDTKKLVSILAGIFVIFFVVTQPNQAADITHSLWHGTVNVFHGVGNFVDKL